MYCKGEYTCDASVTQMLNELQWESLESRRDQFSLIMLYDILKQNTYYYQNILQSFTPRHHTIKYRLQARSSHMFSLSELFCNTDTYKYSLMSSPRSGSSLPCHIVECTRAESFKLSQQNYYYGLIVSYLCMIFIFEVFTVLINK